MSDTPRTDKHAFGECPAAGANLVYSRFARKLERELNLMKRAVEALEWREDDYGDLRCPLCDCLHPEHNVNCIVKKACEGIAKRTGEAEKVEEGFTG